MSEKSIGYVVGETINETASTIVGFFSDFYDGLVGNEPESTPEVEVDEVIEAPKAVRTRNKGAAQ